MPTWLVKERQSMLWVQSVVKQVQESLCPLKDDPTHATPVHTGGIPRSSHVRDD